MKTPGAPEGELILHLRCQLSWHSCASLALNCSHSSHPSPLSLLQQSLQPLLNSKLSFSFEPFHPTLAHGQVNRVCSSRLLTGHHVVAEQVGDHSRECLSLQSRRGRYVGRQKQQALLTAWIQPARVCDQVQSTSFEALWGWFMLLGSLVGMVGSTSDHKQILTQILLVYWQVLQSVYVFDWKDSLKFKQMLGFIPGWVTPLWGFLTLKKTELNAVP